MKILDISTGANAINRLIGINIRPKKILKSMIVKLNCPVSRVISKVFPR
jgi:hypothetical protein